VLVLTRRLNQSIKIGDDIEITIIDVRGDQVRLGVTAPRDVPVHRKEVYLQIQQENLNAARNAASGDAVSTAIDELLQGVEDAAQDAKTAPAATK
jgi:carbon storage regulator